jgi:hypothetical protein
VVLANVPGYGQRSDTTIVRAGAPVHAGVGTLVEELTLGNGSSAAEYQFTTVMLWDAPGSGLFVMNINNPASPSGPFDVSVRRYDRTGRFVRAFGRSGQGPGEYYLVGQAAELSDGRVLVSDVQRGVHVYSATGESLGMWNKGAPGNLLLDPAGFIHIRGSTRPTGRGAKPTPFMTRLRLDGSVVDALDPPHAEFAAVPKVGNDVLPFAPKQVAEWSPLGYFVTANTATYAVELRVPRAVAGRGALPPTWQPGDPVLSIRRTVPAIPVVDAERADWQHGITESRRSSSRDMKWEWTGPEIPRVKPPIRDVVVAADGRIWVRLSQPARLNPAVTIETRRPAPGEVFAERRWAEPWVFDIFEPTGRYVGQVRFPDVTEQPYMPHPGFAIRGDTVWAAVHDQDDIPIIKRYRVNWGR